MSGGIGGYVFGRPTLICTCGARVAKKEGSEEMELVHLVKGADLWLDCVCGDGRMSLMAESETKAVLSCMCGKIAVVWKRDMHVEFHPGVLIQGTIVDKKLKPEGKSDGRKD